MERLREDSDSASSTEALEMLRSLLFTHLGKRSKSDIFSIMSDPSLPFRLYPEHQRRYEDYLSAFEVIDPDYAVALGRAVEGASERIDEEGFLPRAALCAVFARAAYGALMQKGAGDRVSGFLGQAAKSYAGNFKDEDHTEAFVELTGAKREDIVMAHWTEKPFEPAYVVFWVHRMRWLVLSVRGSCEWSSVLTDVAAEESLLAGGLAHSGMARAARWILTTAGQCMAEALAERDEYRLVCTGHSLGADVAELVAVMLREGDTSPTDIPKCLGGRQDLEGSQFTDVTHVVPAMRRIYLVSRGGADGNTVLFELREKPLTERLDVLVKKRMFEWAAEVALTSKAAPEVTAEIYRQHGDALFEKRAYDQALQIYSKTVELGLPLEPSYVVERYLDAQRIGHVAQYLKKLHEKEMAAPEHTALLLKCYTKLKDFTTLEEFLKTTPPQQYDHATAIEVLESAAYHGLAAEVAQKVGRFDDYVRISLEQFKNCSTTVEFLRSLSKAEAGRILLRMGRMLMRHAPKETIALVRHVTDGAAEDFQGPSIDELLPVFVDDPSQLEVFLRSVLLDEGCQLPHAKAESLLPTLLELLVKSHSIASDASEASRISADIMRLIRQYPSDAALANTLMVCQTYGFVDGFFYAAEKLHRHQLLMHWCFEHKDARRLLEVCKRCGPDQSLWVQALSFLASPESGGGHLEEIQEVLRHIEDSDLMPLLLVIETLRHSEEVTIGDVRPYLQAQYKRLVDALATSRGKSSQDRHEIVRMQQEIVQLRTEAKEFQTTRCFQCGLTLDVPAVHFFCGHSYHAYCTPSDGTCPKCSSGALPKLSLKEQREASARNVEDFFKYLQGGAGDHGVQAMGEWCKFGAFDAGLEAGMEAFEDD